MAAASYNPVTPGRATKALAGLAVATTVGYALYSMFFTELHPGILTFATFLPLWVISAAGHYGRRAMVSRPSRLHIYAFALAAFQLGYWYCFWFGIYTLGATIGIAFIALLIFFPPLASHWHTRRTIRDWRRFLVSGIAVIVGVIIVKLDLAWPEFDSRNVVEKLATLLSPGVILFVGCVFFESLQELVKDFMGDEVRAGGLGTDTLLRPGEPTPVGAELELTITNAINALQMTVCILIAAAVLLLVDKRQFHYLGDVRSTLDGLLLAVYGLLLLLLATVGHFYKWKFVDPLRSFQLLAPQTVPIFFAIRPVLFFLLALGLAWVTVNIFAATGYGHRCGENVCTVMGDGINLVINTRITPNLTFTYVTGSLILAAVFVWNLIVFWRSGFAIPLLPPPAKE
jgi:drug/metabolite transporter (DMT)-like permease